jgi:Domain of unknown function (DUF4276)
MVLGPKVIEVRAREKDQQILEAAKIAKNYDVLIVHADADSPKPDKAFKERFLPGLALVKKEKSDEVCQVILPLIPVRMIENWMLADYQTLFNVLALKETDLTKLLKRLQNPEKILKPKEVIEELLAYVNKARSKNKKIRLGDLYEPMANGISLEQLKKLPSFQQFRNRSRLSF